MLLILILYALMASTFTIGKIALNYVTPIFFIGVRMLVGGGLLVSYLALFDRKKITPLHGSWGRWLQIVMFHIYGAYVFEFIALQYISSAKTCLLFSLIPFLSVLFSYKTEHMTSAKWAALVIGFLGFLPVLIASAPAEEVIGGWFIFSWPEMLLFISIACSAQGWLVMQKLVIQGNYSPLFVNGVGMVIGGILALLTALWVESPPFIAQRSFETIPLTNFISSWATEPYGTFFVYTLALIIIANIIGYNLYAHLLRSYSATFIAFAGFTAPLFAAFYDWIFMEKYVSGWFFVSVSIVGVGLYLFYQEEKKAKIIKAH